VKTWLGTILLGVAMMAIAGLLPDEACGRAGRCWQDTAAPIFGAIGFGLYLAGIAVLFVRSRDVMGSLLIVIGWCLMFLGVTLMTTGRYVDGEPSFWTTNTVLLTAGAAMNLGGILRLAWVAMGRATRRDEPIAPAP
jgi:hypothetical protein